MTTKTGATSQNGEQRLTPGDTSSQDATQAKEKPVNPRDAIFSAIAAKRDASLQTDSEYALTSGHPLAVQVEAERREEAAKAGTNSESAAEAGQTAQGVDADEQALIDAATPVDPLADFIVEQAGKPMMRLKVDGKERLVPLETARVQLQKAEAAEVRMQQAAELRKQNEARAAQLAKTEQELKAREAKLRQPSVTSAAVDDQSLREEAKSIVSSLLTDPEEVAAEKLAKVLAKTRQVATPSIDTDAIASRAAETAVRAVDARDEVRSIQSGYTKFQKDYADIASDDVLFRVADGKTDAIKAEHPEWAPAQVMLEAGRQTREWVQSLKGGATQTQTTIEDRQARKDNLRPMPASRTARATTREQGEVQETPADVVREMRKARGLAV